MALGDTFVAFDYFYTGKTSNSNPFETNAFPGTTFRYRQKYLHFLLEGLPKVLKAKPKVAIF